MNQSVIARIGLYNLQNSLNLADNSHGEAWRYIKGGLFFGRVVQNTGTTAWWGQNNTTSSLQVSYWDESSTSWHGPITVNDYTWPNTGYTSRTPDSQAWISTYTGTILAGTRTGSNNLWLAWTAGTGSGRLAWLSQPHIELVDINTSNQHLISQRAIWNPGFAFAYPYLNTSQAGDLGISLAWGGNGVDWTNSAVWDLTRSPFLVWNVTSSNTSCGCGRWGDYLSIRPAYGAIGQGDTNAFVASGYGTNTNPQTQTGAFFDNHYVQFSVS